MQCQTAKIKITQLKCPSTDEWIDDVVYIHTYIYMGVCVYVFLHIYKNIYI